MAEVPQVVRDYFAAVNERRFDDMPALFAEGVELRPVGSQPLRGREQVAAYYPRILAGFAEGFDNARRFHVADDGVVTVEITFTGRTQDGREVAFDAIDVFELDADGRIARLGLWYDSLDVARQVTGRGG
jgi:ketosteroid isomerase-like protein